MKATKRTLALFLALCMMLADGSALAALLELPASLTRIEEEAFYGADALDEVIVPEGVAYIGPRAFGESSVSVISLPKSVTEIADNAFEGCEDAVAKVYYDSFAHQWCKDHEMAFVIADPFVYDVSRNGTAYIGRYRGNTAHVVVPAEIDGYAVELLRSSLFEDHTEIESIVVEEGVQKLENSIFAGCTNLKSVVLPDSITATGFALFSRCYRLESVVLPKNITSIPDHTFQFCYRLTDVSIPENVTYIGVSAFQECRVLSSVTLPDTLEQLGGYAFKGCWALESVTIPGNNLIFGQNVFANCTALKTVVVEEGMVRLAQNTFAGCTALEEITLPDSLLYLESGIFSGCSSLKSIVIPPQVTYISASAFEYCSSLESVVLPAGLKTIEGNAFYECAALETLVVPEGTETIGKYAFRYCEALQRITLPKSLTTIDETAFANCAETLTAVVKRNSYAHTRCVELGIAVEFVQSDLTVTPVPASRIVMDDIPFGMSLDLSVEDGSIYAYIDDEATDWQKVTTFAERLFLYDPETGEEWYETSEINLGMYIEAPEGAAYVAYGPGSWADDDALLAAMTAAELESTERTMPSWHREIGSYEQGYLTTIPVTENEGATTYAVAWADENGEIFLVEKLDMVFEHTHPHTAYFAGMLLIPDGYLVPNVTNQPYVTSRVNYGSIINTFTESWPEILDYIVAPEGTASYSMDTGYYDPHAERYPLAEGRYVPVELIGWPQGEWEISNTYLICWYDTDGNLTGGGWVTLTSQYLPEHEFTYRPNDDGTLTITGYTGTETDLVIPDNIYGRTVTAIGQEAFWENRQLTSVQLPDTITTIEDFAFCWCFNLEEINIPASVTDIGWAFFGQPTQITVEAGNTAYTAADGVLYTADRKTIKFVPNTKSGVFAIPEGVETIDSRAFASCTQITELHIPASVTYAGHNDFGSAFSGMRNLERFVVAEGNTAYAVKNSALVTSDGTVLLAVPAELTGTYTVPEGVQRIHDYAFDDCRVTRVILPEGLTAIGSEVFTNPNLEQINLPESIESIETNAFVGCRDTLLAHVAENSYAHKWCEANGVAYTFDSFDVDSPFTYEVNVDGTLTITGYTGTDTDLVIPETIHGRTVTVIGWFAFGQNKQLTSVQLPDTITTIEASAFGWCSNLAEINIPASVTEIDAAFYGTIARLTLAQGNTAFKLVDGVLYTADGKTLIYCPSTKQGVFVIPEGTQTLAHSAFYTCGDIAELHIPASVTAIESYALGNMYALESFSVAQGNTAYKVENNALLTADGKNLLAFPIAIAGSYTVPDGVENIADSAFHQTWLTQVILPEGIRTIGEESFGASSLEQINLPESITGIAENAFWNIHDQLTATVAENSYAHTWCVENGVNVVFPEPFEICDNGDGTCTIIRYVGEETALEIPAQINNLRVVAIAEEAFALQTELTSVVLPEGLESIAALAFCFCENLTEVHLPSTVSYADPRAFSPYTGVQRFTVDAANQYYTAVDGVLFTKDMSRLVRYPSANPTTSYTVPAGVKEIGPCSMHMSYSLERIVLPNSVTTIDWDAFSHCVSLSSINLPESITFIEDYAFDNVGNVVVEVKNGSYAHRWCVENGVDVQVIATSSASFVWTENEDGETCTITGYTGTDTDVIIPSSIDGLTVSEIGADAFYQCETAITSVVLPSTITNIGTQAFWGCESLTEIQLNKGLQRIGSAFLAKSKVTSLQLPASLEWTEDDAFVYCNNLMNFEIDERNRYFSVKDGVLFNKDGTVLEAYPAGRAGAYTVPEGVTKLDRSCFAHCYELTSLELPDSLQTITWNVFDRCLKLAEMTIPAGVTEIGEGFCNGCASLINFEVEAGNAVYSSVDGLLLSADGTILYRVPVSRTGTLTLPDGVTSIGLNAFYETKVTSVYLPETITSISDFFRCSKELVVTVDEGTYAHLWCVENELPFVLSGPAATPAECFAYKINEDGESCTITQYVGGETEVVIPGSLGGKKVTAISGGAFFDCIDVVSVRLPKGITYIGVQAFCGCENLEEVILPEGLLEIDDAAFFNCVSLIEMDLPESIISIGSQAVPWLERATVIFDSNAYGWCVNHGIETNVIYPYTTSQNADATLSIVKYIGNSSDITVPASINGNTVTTIAANAFANKGVTSVILPEGITHLYDAFGGCQRLISITLPDSLLHIDDDAFSDCSEELVANVVKNSYAHLWCVENGVAYNTDSSNATPAKYFTYEVNADGESCSITGYSGADTAVIVPECIDGLVVQQIGDAVFYEATKIVSVVLPDTVTKIGWGAFTDCTSLESIQLSSNLEYIESDAFSDCSSLKKLHIPAGVTEFGIDRMYNCDSLTEFTVAEDSTSFTAVDGVLYTADKSALVVYPCAKSGRHVMDSNTRTIRPAAFQGYQKIEELVLSVNLEADTIDTRLTFQGCEQLSSITVPEGNTAYSSVDGVLYSADKRILLKCPEGKTGEITVDSATRSIGDYAFDECTKVTAVHLPQQLSSIGIEAFDYCIKLAHISIPDGVENIPEMAFYCCRSLKSVNLPKNLISIQTEAFAYCKLESVVIPEGTETIGECAFFANPNLTVIQLPASLNSIADDALQYCSDDLTATVAENSYAHTWCVENDVPFVLASDATPEEYFATLQNADGSLTITACTCTDAEIIVPARIGGAEVTAIGKGAFGGNSTTTSVWLPATVAEVHLDAFDGASALMEIAVSEEHPVFSTAEGMLMDKDQTTLLRCPEGLWATAQ